MQRRQQIRRNSAKRINLVLCVFVILIVILMVIFLITRLLGTGKQTDKPTGAESTATVSPSSVSTVSSIVTQKPSDVTASQIASPTAVQVKTHWDFQEVLLPQYIKEFLPKNGETDYLNTITALYSGQSSVQMTAISTQKEWEKLRRAVQLTFPPRALLYDAELAPSPSPATSETFSPSAAPRSIFSCASTSWVTSLNEMFSPLYPTASA